MSTYSLKIITPQGKIFDNPVESLVAPGAAGQFGVLAQHAPIIANLKKGILQLTQQGQKKYFMLSGGVLEVDRGGTTLILTDSAETTTLTNQN